MLSTGYLGSLLHTIESLFMKLSATNLQRRMRAYHEKLPSSVASEDISDSILGRINRLAAQREFMPPYLRQRRPIIHRNHVETVPYLAEFSLYEPLDRQNMSDLSRYFRERNYNGELHPDIVHKLEGGIWQHIHEAIRYANCGDSDNTKLHTNIASYACRELAHYMEEQEHKDFVRHIEDYLHEAGEVAQA